MFIKKSTAKVFTVISLIVIISLLAGCGGSNAGAPKDKVTVQFSWFHSAEFIGFYAADQLGYYADENLEVNFIGGDETTDPVAEVASGNAQFGTTSSDAIIRANLAGQKMVAVSVILRKSPLMVMSLTESGIQKPQDLAGKTVGVVSPDLDTTWDIQFLAMLDSLGIDRGSMKFVPNETYSVEDLKSGLMDASSGLFSINELVSAKLAGEDVSAIYLSEYGIETYINPIFTTAQMINEKPDVVQRFVRATLKGYQYAIESPEKATPFVLQYDANLDVKAQEGTIHAMIPLMDTGDAPIGYMDEAAWKTMHDILLEQGVISAPVDLKQVYTNEFIESSK